MPRKYPNTIDASQVRGAAGVLLFETADAARRAVDAREAGAWTVTGYAGGAEDEETILYAGAGSPVGDDIRRDI